MLNPVTALSVPAGAAGLVLFILPVFTGRIVNIGNVTGLLVSACLLLGGLRYERLRLLCTAVWKSGILGRAALTAVCAAAAAIAAAALVLTCLMVRAALRKPSGDADLIVLGCEVKGERPSRMLAGRIETAAGYLQANPDLVCVVSGGKGDGEDISEAECMFRGLTARGIPPERILREDRSASTRENILFSAEILRKAGRLRGGEVTIVTNEFHICRAALAAEKLGLETGAVCSATPWWLFPTFYVRELYGLLDQILL